MHKNAPVAHARSDLVESLEERHSPSYARHARHHDLPQTKKYYSCFQLIHWSPFDKLKTHTITLRM